MTLDQIHDSQPDSASAEPAEFEEPEAPENASAPVDSDDLSTVRGLILKAHPNVIEELVSGNSIAELVASVPAAEEAYSRVAAAARDREPVTVPTGHGRRPPFDPDGLSPEALIREGIRSKESGYR